MTWEGVLVTRDLEAAVVLGRGRKGGRVGGREHAWIGEVMVDCFSPACVNELNRYYEKSFHCGNTKPYFFI